MIPKRLLNSVKLIRLNKIRKTILKNNKYNLRKLRQLNKRVANNSNRIEKSKSSLVVKNESGIEDYIFGFMYFLGIINANSSADTPNEYKGLIYL